MTEAKTPQPGEWWVSDDGNVVDILYIIGTDLQGSVHYQTRFMSRYSTPALAGYKHEPRCTGFDWQEPPAEVWPKYFIYTGPNPCHWDFVKITEFGTNPMKYEDGIMQPYSHIVCRKDVEDWTKRCLWKEITEGEALARVTVHPDDIPLNPVPGKVVATGTLKLTPVTTGNAPPDTFKITPGESPSDPVEITSAEMAASEIARAFGIVSPDDWVEITDPEHIIRECDQISDYGTQWYGPSDLTGALYQRFGRCGFSRARCRRKDLRVVYDPQTFTSDCGPEAINMLPPMTPADFFDKYHPGKPAVKRVPMRLWVIDNIDGDSSSWIVCASKEACSDTSGMLEILHDADGFYAGETK